MLKIKKIKNIMALICVAIAFAAGCGGGEQIKTPAAVDPHADFLTKNTAARELFRVLISSERYEVAQMRNEKTISRKEDNGGDKYMSEEIEKLNKIDEVCEGIYSMWIYPDSGRLMKIRTQKSTYLKEIDELLMEDIQRWAFTSPIKRGVEPTRFDIRYRVVLKKTLSDEEIIKDVQKKMREGH
jgi:hypothetical protein